MINPLFYQSSHLSSLLTANNLEAIIRAPSPHTFERSLFLTILHMLMGLPSETFPLKGQSFYLNSSMPQLHHISRSLLTTNLDQIVHMANKLSALRRWVSQLYVLPHSLVQAFGIGLHEVQKGVEQQLCQKMTILHQEEGSLPRTESGLLESKQRPLCILGTNCLFRAQMELLASIEKIMSSMPQSQPVNNDELNRWSVFLLNLYYEQCQKEHLTGVAYKLHPPFQHCLTTYIRTCRNWTCFNENSLEYAEQAGFFIDFTKALSLNGERFFKLSKIVHQEMIPFLFESHYKQIIELGKTVQFIKFYLSEGDLLLFSQFIDADTEFSEIEHFLNGSPVLKDSSPKKMNSTISSRCSNAFKTGRMELLKKESTDTQNDPFSIEPSTMPFISLRKKHDPQLLISRQASLPSSTADMRRKQRDSDPLENKNVILSQLLGKALESMAMKSRIVMKEHKIKDSIEVALKAIKNFVLLGKGDFLQEFLELSENFLQRPTDKISPNSIQNLIQEAAKASSCHSLYSSVREELSFVFLRGDEGKTKGWKGFSLTYKSRPPVSFIFHGEAMYDYECVGNLLFCLRRCEHVLVGFWRKSFLAGSAPLQHLRTAVHRLVCSLQTYLFSQIQDLWEQLLTVFSSCSSVLELLEANNTFLGRLKQISTDSKPLSNAMLSLLKLVDQFQGLWAKIEEGWIETLGAEIRQLWDWFVSLLDQARQLQPLAGSLNFDFASLHPGAVQ